MKKIFTLLFVMAMVNFAIGQQLYLENSRPKKTEKSLSSKGIDVISAEITTVSYFDPGATVTLNFVITVISVDYEYGDYLEMTFPAGITPLDGSPAIGEGGQNAIFAELLNGIEGQTISWGDDDNDNGGLYYDTPYEFWVEVAVDESLAGTQEIDFLISGDQYGGPPHEFSGTVVLYEIPDVPDLEPKAAGPFAAYYSVPLAQAAFAPQGRVYNYANELTEATDFKLTIGDTYDETLPITIPLGYAQTEYFTFPEYAPIGTGTFTFTYTANASNDYNPDNGTFEKEIEIDSTILSFNNGDIVEPMSIGLPGGMTGNVFYVAAEDVLTAVSFYLIAPTVGDIVSARVFAFDGEPGELIASTMDVVITAPETQYTALFPNEVILSEGYYLIALVEGQSLISVALTSTPFVPNSAWANFGDGWINIGVDGNKHTYLIEGIFDEYVALDFDIALESLTIPNYVLEGNIDISGVIRNMSVDELTSIDIEYTVNGGEALMEPFTGLSVGALETYEFAFANPLSLTEIGAYDIVVTISNANGLGPDGNPDNDQLGTIVNVLDYTPAKMVVGEEATGTWCGYCPRGSVFMEYMAQTYPNSWIGIAVHNNDPMVVPEYDAGIQSWISGYPRGLIDRAGNYDPLDFEEAFNERIAEFSPAELMIESQSIVDGVLTFEVTATFFAKVANFNINAVLLEDYVTGTGAGYAQANYYSGGGLGVMGGYEDLPNPVPAADMVYMDVARALPGGWGGVEGSLPDTVFAGESYSYAFTVALDESWDYDNMQIVGMLINNNSGEIENACVEDVITSILSITNNSELSVYPNPASEQVNIKSELTIETITVYNFAGQIVFAETVNNTNYRVNTSKLGAGIYLFQIETKEGRIATRIIIE